MNPSAFSSLHLKAPLLKNLASLGYAEMTPVQACSLPLILAGKDVIAKAKTGSGKTAAFGIGLLTHLEGSSSRVQALVLCPTRELADQVGKELRRLARFTDNIKILTVCGGVPFGPQSASLEHGAHVVVGTPGRLLDHLRRGSLDLSALRTLVLDEADRMLDMGFQEEIGALIAATPARKQTLLFSATYPESITAMSAAIQRQPVEVSVDELHDEGSIKQIFYEVDKEQRIEAVARILGHYRPESEHIDGGRKNKLRPGDILGALTGVGGIAGSEVGRIDVFDFHTFVAIMRQSVDQALACLGRNRIKGRFFKVRRTG